MNYLVPSFLPFLALAAIPTILYLLFRRRKNDVDWGATYILRLTLQSKNRQNFWKQMFILALRTLFLALLALGFARPFLKRDRAAERDEFFPHGPGNLHRVALFDNSNSMSALHESVTREQAAKAVLGELMMGMRAGDTFHLVLLCPWGAEDPELSAREFPCPISEEEIRQAQVKLALIPAAAAGLETGLRQAKELFSSCSSNQKQLILLSDLTRKDHPDIAGYSSLGEALGKLEVHFAALFLGKTNSNNLALESLTFGADLLLKGQPTDLHVTIMNYGETPSSSSFLSILVDGVPFVETPCPLSPNQRKTFEFPFVPGGPVHRVEARLSEDAYALDNQLERSVDVSDRLRVLVLVRDDAAAENPFEQDAEFFRRVLALPENVRSSGPLQEQGFDQATLWVRRIQGLSTSTETPAETDLKYQIAFSLETSWLPASQATSTEIEKQEIIILSEIDRLSPPVLKALSSFLRRGGGLVLGVGPRLQAASFNDTFKDILPYPLASPFRDLAEKLNYERFLNIQPSDITIPLLKEFEKNTNGDLADGRFYNHFRLELPDSSPPRSALLVLSNGDPALVHRRVGKGIVLLWTSTLGGAWNSMVVHQGYLPLMIRLLNYAASFKPFSRNLALGEPMIWEVTDIEGEIFLTTPDFRLVSCPRIVQGNRQFIRFEDTRLPGLYELQRHGGQPLALFFVSTPDPESDLRPLTPAMEKEFIAGLGVRLPDPSVASLPASSKALKKSLWQQGEGDEITTWAFLAVLLLFLLDAALVKAWFS